MQVGTLGKPSDVAHTGYWSQRSVESSQKTDYLIVEQKGYITTYLKYQFIYHLSCMLMSR